MAVTAHSELPPEPRPSGEVAVIKPMSYDDPETGNRITISVSPFYSKVTVNDREYYFIRETGEFDGTGWPHKTGPILISSSE